MDVVSGEHLFYTSHNLKTGQQLPIITIDSPIIQNLDFDFSSDNIKIKKYFDLDYVNAILQKYYISKDLQFLIDNLSTL